MPNFKKLFGGTNELYKSPYDGRDYHFSDFILAGSVKVPDNYESEMTPFVYNQGKSSMCAACAYNTIRFLQESKGNTSSGITEPFSPAFNYANRPENENFEGMYMRTVCKKGREGSVPYSMLPGFYNLATAKAKLKKDKDKLFTMAKPFGISSFYQVTSREQIKTAIYTLKGVIAGIYVTDEFYNPQNGYVRYNPNNPKNWGGHALAIVGYKLDKNGEFWWRIQNSWGKMWSENGRAWLSGDYPFIESPYAIVDNIDEIKWKEYKEKYMKQDEFL